MDEFSNQVAYELGNKIIQYAKDKNQRIAVDISRMNYSIFHYVFDGFTSDNVDWMRRKANTSKAFEKSTLSIRRMLEEEDISLMDPFHYPEKDFIAHGGCIPVFTRNVGMVGTITVSGLKDTEDHQLILDALEGDYTL